MPEPEPDLADLLVQHETFVLRLVQSQGGALLRLDGPEDLAQGARLLALQRAGSFAWQGEEAFRGWLRVLVRNHLRDRHAHWSAARRNAGPLLRITGVGPRSTIGGGVDPEGARTGPFTFAERRDQWTLAAQAIATLLPRDQELLELEREGAELAAVAERFGLNEESAGRARRRALDRFRRAYELLARTA